MDYKVRIIRKDEQITSSWSGGTTTQLAIYPENGEYASRDFTWRISSARVDLEESTFTKLLGVKRHIMVLEGEMELRHEGHHETVLKRYEKDSFMGDWDTKSYGRVKDFNLMLNRGSDGFIEALEIQNKKAFTYSYNREKRIFEGFYCAEGGVSIKEKNGLFTQLNEGDFILVEMEEGCHEFSIELENQGDKTSYIVRAKVEI